MFYASKYEDVSRKLYCPSIWPPNHYFCPYDLNFIVYKAITQGLNENEVWKLNTKYPLEICQIEDII